MSQKKQKIIKLEIAFRKDEIESIKTNAVSQSLKVSQLLREPALKKAEARIIQHPSIWQGEISMLNQLQDKLEEVISKTTQTTSSGQLSIEHHLGVAREIIDSVCQPLQNRMGNTNKRRFDPTRTRPIDLREPKGYLSVRVTATERDLLQERSCQFGMTIAQFVRATALNKRLPEKSVASDENWKAYAQIMAMNQKIDRLNELTDNLWVTELNAMLKQLRRTMASLIDIGFEEEST